MMVLPFSVVLACLGAFADEVAAENDPARFAVNVLMNSGFELVADSTTTPQKYGSYWREAFVPEKGSSEDRVVEYLPGKRGLLLEDKTPPVNQIVTLYGPYARDFELTLRVRFDDLEPFESLEAKRTGPARLVVAVATQFGRELTAIRYRVGGTEPALAANEQPIVVPIDGPADADGFHRVRLKIGRDMERATGAPPDPWNKVYLIGNGGPVLVDDVVGVHHLPRVSPRELREFLLEDIRDHLAVYLGRPDSEVKGLSLVDPRTGYLRLPKYNVETGQIGPLPVTDCAKHGIHDLMLRYLRIVGEQDPGHRRLHQLVRDRLFVFLKAMLRNNVHPETGLYCVYNTKTQSAQLGAAMAPWSFVDFVLDCTELPFAEFQARRPQAVEVCVRMADTIAKLHREHDLPQEVAFSRGPRGNWFGRLPHMFLPDGTITEPKAGTYNQSWAIKSNRSWYHDFDSAEALARVWSLRPKPEYVKSIDRCIEKFDRQWDAERYDMENDTDDHYGMNVEALLRGFKGSGFKLVQMRDKAQEFTDYRLPRDVAWDDNLWVQGIRLGSFTTGDQPRAFRGPTWLHRAPAEHNPTSAGWRGYEYALREFSKVDLKRRLMDDGYMTDASSWQWEQTSRCFKGDYIDACSRGTDWEGDMGDIFAGPSANAFRCLGRTLEICRPGPDREFIAWYMLSAASAYQNYRMKYGYRFGMNPETGQRYKLRETDPIPWSTTDINGFATVIVHAETLDATDFDRETTSLRIASVAHSDAGAEEIAIDLVGPPGRAVTVHVAAETVFADVGVTDWRLRHVDADAAGTRTAAATFDDAGHARVTLARPGGDFVAIDAIVMTADGEDVDDLASGEYRL